MEEKAFTLKDMIDFANHCIDERINDNYVSIDDYSMFMQKKHETYLLSVPSLNEDWDSEEDKRYDRDSEVITDEEYLSIHKAKCRFCNSEYEKDEFESDFCSIKCFQNYWNNANLNK